MAEKLGSVTVLNRGRRTYQLQGKKTLAPNESVEVSGREAELLLGFHDIVDVAKIVKRKDDSAALAKLQAENDALKRENSSLKGPDEKKGKR